MILRRYKIRGSRRALRTVLFAAFCAVCLSCAIDPVPTPADRADGFNGGTVGLDTATAQKDSDLAPSGGGCTCTDDQGNTVWCDGEGYADAGDAHCTCDAIATEACPEGAETCEVVDDPGCSSTDETCAPPASDDTSAD